jgi:type I restriction enzyme S subunit
MDPVRPGTEWLRQAPDNWDIIPVKYCTECLDSQRIPLNSEERDEIQGEIPYWGAGGVVDHINDWIFNEELVLLGEDGAPFGEPYRPVAHYVNERVWVNNHIHILRPGPSIKAQFLVHALNCVDYAPFLSGSTRDKLTQDAMGEIPIPCPSLSKQECIIDYIQNNTSNLDKLISEKEDLLEKLDEKRDSLVTHYITNGGDSQDLVKDSGIPTFGKIPAHWEVVPNTAVFDEISNESEDGKGELLSVSENTGVTPRSEKEVNMFEAESLEGYKIAKQGDLIINTMWAWKGATGISPQRGLVSPSYHVYRPNDKILPEFADFLYRSPPYVSEMARFSEGVWKSRNRLYPDVFLRMDTVLPPKKEQKRIVNELSSELREIEDLSSKLESSIEILKEKRKAIIVKAVTGQVDLEEHKSQVEVEV